MGNSEFWDKFRGTIRSRRGGWKAGKGVFNFDYDMMEDLVGKASYMQVIILNATGRLPDRKLADWFEACHICLSWPDPRIWCNQIGALAGSVKTSPIAATVAGSLAGDSIAYGHKPFVEGLDFIQAALKKKIAGHSAREIVADEIKRHNGKARIMGYARPVAKGDERIEALERTAAGLDLKAGEHLQLAYEIEQVLYTDFDESMNINGYMSAVLSDEGFTPEEVYRITAVMVMSGVTACYIDTYERPANTFLPMRCDDIDYQGPAPREVPDRDH